MSITIFLCIAIAIISFAAFSNHNLIEQLVFYPYKIWRKNEWHRLISCSFIHGDAAHLIFNLIALYSFGVFVEEYFAILFNGYGITLYIIMYFLAVALADVYHLFTRKDDPTYRSLGASGGVSAIVFASILLNPMGKISLMFLPGIPSFVFGPLYLLYTAFMAKRGGDNVGHMAHLTGSVFGFVFPILFKPALFPAFLSQILH
jgi:membrane associated rhomboid family serine protease